MVEGTILSLAFDKYVVKDRLCLRLCLFGVEISANVSCTIWTDFFSI